MVILRIFFSNFGNLQKGIFGNIYIFEKIFLANGENLRCLEMKELT
jgi:hypothetical protein